MLKKIYLLFFLIIILSGCGNKIEKDNFKIDNSLPAISKNIEDGVLVSASDSHPYTKKGPELFSGSYYFNPRNFYIFNGNASIFLKAYSSYFDNNKVYYYDDVDGYNAGLIVYILRNIFNKKNVSLVLNSKFKKNLKYNQKFYNIKSLAAGNKLFTGGYIGTGKYLVVYNPNLIKFTTGDLLLIPAYKIDYMNDNFYKKNKDKLNIKSINPDEFITFEGELNPKNKIKNTLSKLDLQKYKKVYIYYPKYWYRAGLTALILYHYFRY